MPSMKEFQDLRKKAAEWWEQAAEYLQPIFGEISWERTWKHLVGTCFSDSEFALTSSIEGLSLMYAAFVD